MDGWVDISSPEREGMPDRSRSSQGWGVRFGDINRINPAVKFYGPQFIVDSDGNSLSFSLSDKKSITSQPFNAGLNQQWLVHEDGSGGVALMTKYNRSYLGPKDPTNPLEDATLISTNVPFWFEIFPGKVGYKLGIPGTDLGISLLGESAKLSSLSSIAVLFIMENTPSHEKDILSGRLIPSATSLGNGPTRPVTFKDELDAGTNVTVAINDLSGFTTHGIKNLVINLGQRQITSRSSPSSSVTPSLKGVTGPSNAKCARPVISESLPIPTATPGTADIVGFGIAGVTIARNSMNVQKFDIVPSFGYDAGWRVDKHVRLVADTTGNKRADLVGFGDTGVWISQNNGDNTFQDPKMVLTDFSYAAGWRVDKHLRFMADIRNTGRADIVGFGDDGVFVSLNNGDGTFSPATLVMNIFGYLNTGWRLEKHPRFLADTNGNGYLDIVGFAEKNVCVAYNNGDGTFQRPKDVLADLCYSTGWRVDQQPRFVADMTGNGKPDLVGFAQDGIYVALNNGDGTFQPIRKVSTDFTSDKGWVTDKHPRFIADLTGNGCGDIIGFGEEGVIVAINNGDGTFQPAKLATTGFSYKLGWRVKQHPRFMVDLTGNGRADIIGFGNTSAYASYNDGKGNFTAMTTVIPYFGYEGGWTPEKTERYVSNLFL